MQKQALSRAAPRGQPSSPSSGGQQSSAGSDSSQSEKTGGDSSKAFFRSLWRPAGRFFPLRQREFLAKVQCPGVEPTGVVQLRCESTRRDPQVRAKAGKSSGGSPDSQKGGESGGGNQAGNQGGGGQSRVGGGAASGAGTANPNPPKDDSKPSPPAQEPENRGGDTVAPEGQPQSDLVLRKLHDVLNDPASAKDLEQRMNMTREQLEQFVTKFKKVKSGPAGPGRDINVKPGEQTPVAPAANLPGLDAKTRFSSKNHAQARNHGAG